MAREGSEHEADVSEGAFWMTTFEEHGSAVMAFLTSRTRNRDLAEDLLQETFVRAMRARRTLPDRSGVRAYLLTTAHHLLLSRYRKKRPLLFSEVTTGQTQAIEERADMELLAPDAVLDAQRLRQRLDGVLERLRPDHRTAFELAVLQQMPYSEVAESQGWSLGQVKTNVHRARKQVITALGDLLRPCAENRS